jgi:hypothetical protein
MSKDIVFWPSGLPSDQDRNNFRRSLAADIERMNARIKIFVLLCEQADDVKDVDAYLMALERVSDTIEVLSQAAKEHWLAVHNERARRRAIMGQD